MQTYSEYMHEAAQRYWRELMEQTHDNVAQAARIAHMNRTHIYKVIDRYGIPRRHKHYGNWAQFGL